MLFRINVEKSKETYALFKIVDDTGTLLHVGVTLLPAVMALHDVPAAVTGDVNICIVETDGDRLKLGNRALAMLDGMPVLRQRLIDTMTQATTGKRGAAGRAVRCVETGEYWPSAYAASRAQGVSYGQLHQHLKKNVGYNRVKGKTYVYS